MINNKNRSKTEFSSVMSIADLFSKRDFRWGFMVTSLFYVVIVVQILMDKDINKIDHNQF
ncbi:MAG: hypothetical protein LBC02_02415, partial [Planctomycetaceae bacterium]|nr:hypothetical protein [Planctomycetaceae bacterium]